MSISAAYMFSDTVLLEWMLALEKYGLALINKMSVTEAAVIDAAERIDYLRRTNFGKTFDVVSVPKPINLAYTVP
jgi:gamma-butyrobetaine dioxygenase